MGWAGLMGHTLGLSVGRPGATLPRPALGGGEMQTMANHMYAVGSSEARRAFILVLLSVFV